MFRSEEKIARNEFYSLKNTDQLNNRLRKMTFIASAREAAPASPMLLFHRFSSVSVVLTFIASAREAAPAAPIVLFDRLSSVSVVLTFIVSAREAAPAFSSLSQQGKQHQNHQFYYPTDSAVSVLC